MKELKDIVKERLSETFKNDTQEVVAGKILTTQGNVSKMVNGTQIPTTETLIEISKAYKVSVDWLLGISEDREIYGVSLDELTYEQLAKILDRLIDNNTLEIPDLNETLKTHGLFEDYFEDEENECVDPVIDSDYLKINDRLMSYLMRRRIKLLDIDLEMLADWKEKLDRFNGLRLLLNDNETQELIDAHSPSSYRDGDWVELIEKIAELDYKERQELLIKLKEKEGKE